MDGWRVSGETWRMIRRALTAGLLIFTAAMAAAATPALAEPLISIESPASGEVTNETRPTFAGFTSDTEDPVVVTVSKGGSPVESLETTPKGTGEWSVRVPSDLGDGSYTALAEQTETLTGEPGSAGPIGFTIDTQSPTVTLTAVPSPSNDSTPSFSGTASDTGEVTVYVFKGSSPGGTKAAEVSSSVSGGVWS